MVGKNSEENKRCHRIFCWRKASGYIVISAWTFDMLGVEPKKIPYCEKHGKIARQIIEEEQVVRGKDGTYRLKPKKEKQL